MICSYGFILVSDWHTSKVNTFITTEEGWGGGYNTHNFRRKVIWVILKLAIEESPDKHKSVKFGILKHMVATSEKYLTSLLSTN